MTKNQNLKKNHNSGISKKTFIDSAFVFNKSSTRIPGIILVEYLYNTI